MIDLDVLLNSIWSKQVSRWWNQRLTGFLTQVGFRISSYDPCVYLGYVGESLVIIAIYFDDRLIAVTDKEYIQTLLS